MHFTELYIHGKGTVPTDTLALLTGLWMWRKNKGLKVITLSILFLFTITKRIDF